MSMILQYFKRVPRKSNEQFPEPNGPLSSSVPPKAIELANANVAKAVKDGASSGQSKRSGPYLMLSGAQRFEIGKRAAEHGVTASLRYYAKKYPELPLKESSVRRFKNLYQERLASSAEPTEELKELPRKKEGRPLLLPNELDDQVKEYVKDLRKRGHKHLKGWGM